MSSILRYSLSSRSISPCVRSTSARSLGVRPPAPGCAACRVSAVSARNQVSARSRTAASPSSAASPRPVRRQPRAVRPVQRQRVDLDQMRQRHRRIAAAPPRLAGFVLALIHAGRRPVRAIAAGRKPPQIVEAELRRRRPGKLRRRRAVEIAQQPIAQPLAGHRPQLLLDRLQRPAQRRPARQRLLQIEQARIEPHRIEAGEPAHRPRQINVRRHRLAARHFLTAKRFLTAMPFEIEQHRMAAAMMRFAP